MKKKESRALFCLCCFDSSNTERSGCFLDKFVGSLEPPLVSSLCFADVKLASVHGGCDQLMLTTFISIGRSCQHGQVVVWFPTNVLNICLQNVCCCHCIVVKASLQGEDTNCYVLTNPRFRQGCSGDSKLCLILIFYSLTKAHGNFTSEAVSPK